MLKQSSASEMDNANAITSSARIGTQFVDIAHLVPHSSRGSLLVLQDDETNRTDSLGHQETTRKQGMNPTAVSTNKIRAQGTPTHENGIDSAGLDYCFCQLPKRCPVAG